MCDEARDRAGEDRREHDDEEEGGCGEGDLVRAEPLPEERQRPWARIGDYRCDGARGRPFPPV